MLDTGEYGGNGVAPPKRGRIRHALPLRSIYRAPWLPMVDVLIALIATVAALGGAGLLAARTRRERRIYLLVWTVTLAGLALALSAMTVGFAMGFRSSLFRAIELGGALIAPVSLAVGVVELIARSVPARFLTRLFAVSYVIVAPVVVLLDPVTGKFDKSLPQVSSHFSSLPQSLLDLGHIFAIVVLVGCIVVTVFRARGHDRGALAVMLTVAMVALAGVLIVASVRGFLPGPVAPLALGAAAVLVWFGVTHFLNVPPKPRPRREEHENYDDYESGYDMGHAPYPEQPREFSSHNYQTTPTPPSPPPSAYPPGPIPPREHAPVPQRGMCGRVIVYTIEDGSAEAFDRLTEDVTRAVTDYEPNALVYSWHWVTNAPSQRITYQLFKDMTALEEHERYPHVQRFNEHCAQHVVATNVIELLAGAAKVAPPPPPTNGVAADSALPPLGRPVGVPASSVGRSVDSLPPRPGAAPTAPGPAVPAYEPGRSQHLGWRNGSS